MLFPVAPYIYTFLLASLLLLSRHVHLHLDQFLSKADDVVWKEQALHKILVGIG